MLTTIVLAVVTLASILVFLAAMEGGEFTFAAVMLLVGCFFGYAFYSHVTEPSPPPTAEQLAVMEKRKVEIEEAKIPKVFSASSDGCVVYKFKDNGYNHYFTRCEKLVTTNSTYRSGKYTKVESIQTNQEQAK